MLQLKIKEAILIQWEQPFMRTSCITWPWYLTLPGSARHSLTLTKGFSWDYKRIIGALTSKWVSSTVRVRTGLGLQWGLGFFHPHCNTLGWLAKRCCECWIKNISDLFFNFKIRHPLYFKGTVTRFCACAAPWFLVWRTFFQDWLWVKKSSSIDPEIPEIPEKAIISAFKSYLVHFGSFKRHMFIFAHALSRTMSLRRSGRWHIICYQSSYKRIKCDV